MSYFISFQISSLKTQIQSQESDLKSQEDDLNRAKSELNRLQQEETQLEQSIQAGKAQLETIIKSLKSTQDEINQVPPWGRVLAAAGGRDLLGPSCRWSSCGELSCQCVRAACAEASCFLGSHPARLCQVLFLEVLSGGEAAGTPNLRSSSALTLACWLFAVRRCPTSPPQRAPSLGNGQGLCKTLWSPLERALGAEIPSPSMVLRQARGTESEVCSGTALPPCSLATGALRGPRPVTSISPREALF